MATEPNIKLEVLQGGAGGRNEAPVASPDSDPGIAKTPGQILSSARQEQGLEQVDICDRLRLQSWVVDALEKDEYHRLAAPTYARGYLCNYANLLEIPEAEVLNAYDLVRADKPASTANAKRMVSGSETRAAGADGPSKWAPMVGLGLLLGVLGLFAAWWFGDRGGVNENPAYADSVAVSDAPELNPYVAEESQPAVDEPSEADFSSGMAVGIAASPSEPVAGLAMEDVAPAAVNEFSEPVAVADVAEEPDELSAAMIAAAEAEAAFEAQQTAVSAAFAAEPVTPVAAPNEVVTNNEPVVESDGIPFATTYPVDQQTRSVAARSNEQPAAIYADDGRISISLYFQQDSWAEVRDANGSKLVYRLGQAGTSTDVRGYPPFQVFLGNSPGVEVQLNGSPYDTTQHHRPNNTARFRVGADS